MPINYYQMKKHEYRERYERTKERKNNDEILFKDFGGERNYYKMKYKEFGFYGGPRELETAPEVAGVGLAGTAGVAGLTATDVRAGKERLDGADPVVG